MNEPICKIARDTDGEVPLECLFPSGCKHNCHAEYRARQPLRIAKVDLTCRSCGAPCRWQEVWGDDGQPKTRLFEGGKPHVCKNTAEGFESIA